MINTPFPAAAQSLNVDVCGFPSWVEAAYHHLEDHKDDLGLEISVAFPSSGPVRQGRLGNSVVATFPSVMPGRERKSLSSMIATIKLANPSLVHIFGTENPHASTAAQACVRLGLPFVVGLQGLSSTIGHHYLSGLPAKVSYGLTLRDVVRRDSIARQASKYARGAEAEGNTIRLARHVIGRTTWDKAVAQHWNPEAKYYQVPETLRREFYAQAWDVSKAQRHSIFMSQGHYPIKGLHFVLQALHYVIRRYPDTELVVAGAPPRGPSVIGRLRQTSYGRYIWNLIKQLQLADHVRFIGIQNVASMVSQYLRAHVFVSASSVENESNSLSEALLLGVPAVASYVGGVTDRVQHGATGFYYQHDAPYMLAYFIAQIFENDSLALSLSRCGRSASLRLNDPHQNAKLLRFAYMSALSGEDW